MRRSYRIIRKKYASRRYGFKNYRAFRRTGRISRSNRIFRRFANRTATRPELKHNFVTWNTGKLGQQTGAVGTFYTQSLTPLTLVKGTADDNRIGNKVNFIKVDMRMWIKDDSDQASAQVGPSKHTFPVRIIIWTPRRPYAQSAAYIQALGQANMVDFDYVTCFMDNTFQVYPSYIYDLSNDPAPGGGPCEITFQRRFKFPRKIQLDDTNNDLDPQKDILYCTCLCNTTAAAGVIVYNHSRTWYFDS